MGKQGEQKTTLRSCHLVCVGRLNMGGWVPQHTRGLVNELYIGVVQGREHLRGPGLPMPEHVNTGRWVFHHRGWRSAERGNTSTEPAQGRVHQRVLSTMMLVHCVCPWHLCRHFIVLVVKALGPHPPAFCGVHKHLQQLTMACCDCIRRYCGFVD